MYEEEVLQQTETKPGFFKNIAGKIGKGVYDVIETLVIAIAIVVFIYLFVASPHEVVGRSMETNFWNGEYLLADKISYKFRAPRQGEVIIFEETETADYIKRIISLPGDTVELRDGKVWVNGKLLVEDVYLDPSIYTYGDSFLKEGEPYKVPDSKFFVLGDNRGHSSDSRAFGPVDSSKIKGRAVLVYWPFNHLKTVPQPAYNTK